MSANDCFSLVYKEFSNLYFGANRKNEKLKDEEETCFAENFQRWNITFLIVSLRWLIREPNKFNLVPRKVNSVPKKFYLVPKKILFSTKTFQYSAEKIHNLVSKKSYLHFF